MTANERKKAFLQDLQVVLNRHRAEIQVTDDGKPYGLHHGLARVTLDANEDGPFTEFDLPGYMTADSADVMHDNNTDVIVQTVHPSLSPTHYCVDCGALWRQCDDFSMNLRSASCCDACNNAPVGPQIRPIYLEGRKS